MKGRGWLVYLVLGTTLSVVAAFSRSSVLIGLVTQLVGWVGLLVWLRDDLRKSIRGGLADRPWTFFALGGAAFLVAGAVRTAHGSIVGEARPFPSPADAIALAGHVILIIGGNVLGHLRSPDRNRAAIIDGAIIAAGLQTLVWAFLLWPYVTDGTIPWDDRAINCIYAAMTMTLLAAIGRLAIGPGARTMSYRLLAGAVVLLFVQDVLVTVETVGGPEATLGRALAPFIYVLVGAAAGHPDRLRISEAVTRLDVRLSWRRAAVLITALLINPMILAVQLATGARPALVVVAVSSTALTFLVLARFVLLSRFQERAVDVQRIQRDANAELATASNRPAMHHSALRAAGRLAAGVDGLRVSISDAVGDGLAVVEAIGVDAAHATGSTIDLDTVPTAVAEGLRAGRPVVVDGTPAIDLGPDLPADARSVSILTIPLTSQAGLLGALVVTTARPITEVLRQSLETLGSTVALALESASLTEEMLRRRSERRFRALVDNSSDIVLVVDEAREITYASPAAQRLLGLAEDLLVGSHPARWVHPDDWPALAGLIDDQVEDGSAHAEVEVRISHVDGSHRWFEMRTKDVRHEPEILGVVITAREITDRKRTEQALAASESRFRALVQNSTDVVGVIDPNGIITYLSPAISAILGIDPEDVIGMPVVDLLDPAGREDLRRRYPEIDREVLELHRITEHRLEVPVVHRSGAVRVLEVELTDLRHEPSVAGIVLNARDITDRKELERDLRHQATHDALTGLANRTMFTQEAASALQAAGPHGVTVGALLIDLDDFQTVNDSLGHAVGDVLLQQVADRLRHLLAPDQLAARLGGDEYAVLVLHADDPANGVLTVADEVLAGLAEPFRIDGRELRVTASIGIAVADGLDDATGAEVLLRNADVAMYQAKAAGKDGTAVFADHHHRTVVERMELKADLTRAIEEGQLRCAYQPVVSLQTGRVTGTEALVRWDHPTRGPLAPDSFIPLAESTGLVVDIGRWMLHEACQQLRSWQLQLPAAASFTVSVNLSVRQLEQADIVDEVRRAIDQAGIEASTLTLEITETSLMTDTDLARQRLAELRDLGVSIAVDDFGTGYSSLQYVQSFPIDVLKIDRTFVQALDTDTGVAVVQSMVELAQRLGVHTVAEGIERPVEVEVLRRLGADLAQGYLYSRPVPAAEIDRLLAADPTSAPHLQPS